MEQNYTNDLGHGTGEPEPRFEIEPRNPPPPAANDDAAEAGDRAASPADPAPRNESGDPVPPRVVALRAAIMAEHAARFADPERDPAIMEGLVREFGAAWAELPHAEAG